MVFAAVDAVVSRPGRGRRELDFDPPVLLTSTRGSGVGSVHPRFVNLLPLSPLNNDVWNPHHTLTTTMTIDDDDDDPSSLCHIVSPPREEVS